MTEYNEIILSKSGHTSTVTLNRPNSLNSITPTMLGELNDAIAALEADNDTFVVLTGQGRAFSGGVDLKALERGNR